jgi:hypothetical protein
MRVRSWNRCLAFNSDTGAWCQHRPSDGVFCPSHAREFRSDEAAKAATRLVRAELVRRDPSATPWQRWRSERQAARARSLRTVLLAEIDRTDESSAAISVTARNLVRASEIDR